MVSSTDFSALNEENCCEVIDKTFDLEHFNSSFSIKCEKEDYEIEHILDMPKHHEYFCTPDKLMKCLQPYEVLDPVLQLIELEKVLHKHDNNFNYEAPLIETEIDLDCHPCIPENLELEDDLVQFPTSNEGLDVVLEMKQARNVNKQVD